MKKSKSKKQMGGKPPRTTVDDGWFVYMLRCADRTLYTGITKDMERRLAQHNAGKASRYTRSRLPVTVEYREEQLTQSSALKRELQIKSFSRIEKERLIEQRDDQ